jgi:hypothetical protein
MIRSEEGTDRHCSGPASLVPITAQPVEKLSLRSPRLPVRQREPSTLPGTIFPKEAWNRWTRSDALRSGRDFPRRIIRREAHHDGFLTEMVR